MTDIERLKQDIVFRVTLRGHDMVFHSTWGLFSPRRVDEGSAMLIDRVQINPDDYVLDLGCGYGVLGLAAAMDCPNGQVHLVDKDYIAVEYARKNAVTNGLNHCHTYLSNAFSEVPPDARFHVITANLPAKVGGELLTIILQDARAHLHPEGRLVVVTVNGLRKFIRRNFEDVFGNYRKVKQGSHYTVAEAVRPA